MQARRSILIATLTLGILMSPPSAATSPIYNGTPHVGMSRNAIERAYIESFEQSGFRLASRKEFWNDVGSWDIELEFQLKSEPMELQAAGTTLSISGYRAMCPCNVRRETLIGLDYKSPEPKVYMRGQGIVMKAETAALAKVRKRLGVSLPPFDMPTP